MTKQIKLVAFAALALTITGCSKAPSGDDAAPLTLHEIMKDKIDANADKLWDVSNTAIAQDAGLDPTKMDDQKWAEIARLAGEVKAGAKQLAALNPAVVVKPGVKILDEGLPGGDTAAKVQGHVDKDPEGLRDMANTLAAHMDELVSAAKAKDAAKAGPLVDQLDQVCESCHLEFWYPQQRALIEALNAKVPAKAN